jgi:thiamine biosynthesis lipoprotein
MTLVVNYLFKGALGRPFLALAAALAVGCASESEFVVQGEAQGSTFVVRAYGDSLNLSESDVARWLADYNKAVSVWDPQSELSRLNRGGALAPSLILSDLLRMTEGIRVATDSLVEPALEPVLRAWGFTAGTQLLPSAQGTQRDSVIIDSLMALVRWAWPETTPEGTRLAHPINVNAFAQGHSVDLVLDSLRARGATAAFVEIGGEVRCFGHKPNGDVFKVGIEKPLTSGDRSLQLTVELEDRALATSGNYRKFQVDSATGQRFGHSLDPRTGWPAPTDVLSATLIGPSCAEADAYATMAMVLGVDGTKQWLAQHPEWDAILIYSDAQGALQIYNSLK